MAADYEIKRALRTLGVDPGTGVWVSRDTGSDRVTVHIFGTEIEALRHAMHETSVHQGRKVFEVTWMEFGENALTYKEPE